LETLAWKLPGGPTYALEGSCFVAGAAIQWLRDGLGLITSAADAEALAASVDSSDGVVFVPALAGLGAPYWDADARGLISGITRGTTRAHLARATLEGIAFQVDALIEAMRQDTGAPIQRLRVDGGAAANDLLMQLQADFSGLKVDRPRDLESTARGAAMFAGLGVGMFQSPEDAARMIQTEREFSVTMNETRRLSERRRFAQAVARARSS
jgi:glycerol kinase